MAARQGIVTEVRIDPNAGKLLVDADIGDTVLYVDDVSGFNPDGGPAVADGMVDISADETADVTEPITYGAVDLLEKTIQLTAPLVNAYPAGSTITAPGSTTWVIVDDGSENPLQECELFHGLKMASAMVEGIRDEGLGEQVIIEEYAGRWFVINIIAQAGSINGQLIDPDLGLPPGVIDEPTEAPTEAPVLQLEKFAVGSLRAFWEAIDGASWYNLYASLTPGVDSTDPANREVEGITNLETLLAAIDHVQIPVDGTPVYVVVRAANALGEGPPSNEATAAARQADAEFLSALFAWFGTVEAQEALFGKLRVIFGIEAEGGISVGDLVSLTPPTGTVANPVGGFVIRDPTNPGGKPLIRLHPLGSLFRGEVITDILTVMLDLMINGTAHLSSGATFFVDNGVADPPAGPTPVQGPVQTGWDAVPSGYIQRGIAWDAGNNRWVRILQRTSDNRAFIQYVSTAGVASPGIILARGSSAGQAGVTLRGISGITIIGTSVYYIEHTYESGPQTDYFTIIRCSLSTGAAIAGPSAEFYQTDSEPIGQPALGTDGANVYVLWTEEGVNYVLKLNADLTIPGGVVNPTVLTGAVANANNRYVGVGDLGYGASKLTIGYGTAVDVFPLPTFTGDTVAKDAALSWTLDATVLNGGIAYKTSGADQGFYSTHADGKLSRWDSWMPGAGEKMWFRSIDTGGGDRTGASPVTSLSVDKHRFAFATLRPAPAGIDGGELYVGYGVTTPTRFYKRSEVMSGRGFALVNGRQTTGAPLATVNVTNKVLGSVAGQATLTSTGHGLQVGQRVLVNIADAAFNGTFTITAVTANTFSYALAGSSASAATTGTATTLVPSSFGSTPATWRSVVAGWQGTGDGKFTVRTPLTGPEASNKSYVDGKQKAGRKLVDVVNGTSGPFHVTFNEAFPPGSLVSVQTNLSTSSSARRSWAGGLSNTGFDIYAVGASAATGLEVMWTATLVTES